MDTPVLDREEALERLEGDVELWTEICAIWLEDSGRMLRDVQAAMESKSPEALRRAAHAMKGASANVGAARVAAKANEIERSAPLGDWIALSSRVGELAEETEAVRRALSGA